MTYGQYAPPKKPKTWLWITLVLVFVLIAGGVAFTGFVTPGFFKSKADTTSRATPEQLSQSFVNGVNEERVSQLWCAIRSKRSYAFEQAMATAAGAQLSTPAHQRAAQEYSAAFTSAGLAVGIAMIPGEGGWCVRDAKVGGEPEPLPGIETRPSPRPDVKTGEEAGTKFVDAINARDIPAALSVLCDKVPDTTRDGVQQVIHGEASYTVDKADVLTTAEQTILHLSGLIDGVQGPGRVETEDGAEGGPCVTSFSPDSD
ncbi:hypothetical protein [Amycolatopsis sp. BJA-103]|uniref:hypothetical protein n=1 Tax=Amycolatopsis sp. BJA-103 TaxID=1911175 RepID=UPI000C79358B|nr:hypothetical protein [Amycolatopsis sp. BJA-103]AUI62375.1 hypothetical protein BKN51_32275 [Amycolatopsis sp. BJA-103]PNE20318.1 hypothetical protein B1H26_00140 [Amycolatopsis sp. BJA-103]